MSPFSSCQKPKKPPPPSKSIGKKHLTPSASLNAISAVVGVMGWYLQCFTSESSLNIEYIYNTPLKVSRGILIPSIVVVFNYLLVTVSAHFTVIKHFTLN